MNDRRSTYFIFQALLTVVLLLFFFYRQEFVLEWSFRMLFIILMMSFLLIFLALAPASLLKRQGVQAAWFMSDVFLSSLTLYWSQQVSSDLYVTYFLVIFGTALTENIVHSFLVALVATLLYGYSAFANAGGRPVDPEFWLRLPYLWIFASFTALLTRDSRESRKANEQGYRDRLFHMERLAALGQISAEVAHHIKAPLTTIRVNAEVMAHQPGIAPAMRKELIQIEQEVDRCKQILQKLLELGRIEEMDIQRIDLKKSLDSALETIRPQLTAYGIHLHRAELDRPAFIQGDSILVTEAILAVLQNAVEAMPSGGTLRVGLQHVLKGPWWTLKHHRLHHLELTIQDTGIGIKPDQLETIFRPFFTTKRDRGNGLGLSAALRILDKHGGSVTASSPGTGQGACFTLIFPQNHELHIN